MTSLKSNLTKLEKIAQKAEADFYQAADHLEKDFFNRINKAFHNLSPSQRASISKSKMAAQSALTDLAYQASSLAFPDKFKAINPIKDSPPVFGLFNKIDQLTKLADTYESANHTISRKKALHELQNHHLATPNDIADFDATFGVKEFYRATDVLDWLGY
jgi:hypothetical protein